MTGASPYPMGAKLCVFRLKIHPIWGVLGRRFLVMNAAPEGIGERQQYGSPMHYLSAYVR
jgi:hypothetical protein